MPPASLSRPSVPPRPSRIAPDRVPLSHAGLAHLPRAETVDPFKPPFKPKNTVEEILARSIPTDCDVYVIGLQARSCAHAVRREHGFAARHTRVAPGERRRGWPPP